MRISYLQVLLFLGIFILSGCSGMKLMNSYKSDNFQNFRTKKMLVISGTPLEDIRKEYELEIVKKLKADGFNAVASHLAFPDLQRIDNKSTDRIAEVVTMFRKEGFDVLVLTSLKDVQELDVMREQGGYSSYEEYYGNQYVTLKGYYDDVYAAPKLPPNEVDAEITYVTETTYVLQGVVYNLDLEQENRLLSVVTAEITNPDSGTSVRKGFAKILAAELK